MKSLPVALACAAAFICGIWTTDALALTAKNFQGECISKFKSWKKRGGYGAAAIARNGHCGFSWDYGSAEQARQRALSSCRFGGKGKGCVIVAENQTPSRTVAPSIKGTAETLTLKAFQTQHKLSSQAMRERFGAVGRITCPWSTATVFLISQADTFITSDHVFVSAEKKAADYGHSGKCYIKLFYSKQRYKIRTDTLVHGLKTNKYAFYFNRFDWAVGKLDRSVEGVQPYTMGTASIEKGSSIIMVSQGINDLVPRACLGNVSATLVIANLTEFTTNCDSGPGTSGGPVVAGGIDGIDGDRHAVVGITWGVAYPLYGSTPSLSHVAIPLADVEIKNAIDRLLQDQARAPQ